jgi:hypothetical protein
MTLILKDKRDAQKESKSTTTRHPCTQKSFSATPMAPDEAIH